jgi:hypothetical protein
MGQAQGTGRFGIDGEGNEIGSKSQAEIDAEKAELLKMLEKKKFEMYKLLELYHYNIKIAILEESLKLKNEKMVSDLDVENKALEKKKTKLKEKYAAVLQKTKEETVENEKNNLNVKILFYVSLGVILISIALILFLIFKKN